MGINFWRREESSENFSPEAVMAADMLSDTPAEVSEKARPYMKVVSWTLMVAAFLVPLFFLPFSTSVLELNKQLLLVIAAGIGLVAWLLGIVVSGQMSFRHVRLDWGVLALLLAFVVSTIFSLAPTKSLFGVSISVSDALVTILALSLLYFLMINVFDDHGKKIKNLFLISAVAALVLGVLQLFTVYVLPFDFTHSRAFNTVGSINSLGLLAALLLPMWAKTPLLIRGNKYLDVSKLGIALGLIMLALLNWWVLWLIASMGMLAMIAFDSVAVAINRQQGGVFKTSRFILPMTVIVLAVFLLVVNFNFAPVKNNLPVEVAPSFRLSTDIAKNVLKQDPVFGYGPENFSVAFDRFGAGQLANSTLSNVKFFDGTSEMYNALIHGGIVGLLAMLLLIIFAVMAMRWFRHAIGSGSADEGHATGLAASLVAILVALFFYPFNITLFFTLYLLLAITALSLVPSRKRVMSIEENPVVSLASSLGFIIGLILVLTGFYFTAAWYVADVAYARALTQTDTTKAIDGLVSAVNWNAKNDRYYRSLSQSTLELIRQEINKRADPADTQRTARIQNSVQSAINFARRATEVEPNESNNWFNLGTVYQALIGLVDGVDRLAEDSFIKAAELRPGDPSFHNRIGSMYLAKADLSRQLARSAGANALRLNQEADAELLKAEEGFKKAIDLGPNFGLAIYNLGAVYDRQGKVSEAIRQLERIAPFNTNQPSLMFELGLLYYRVGRKDDSLAAFQQAVFLTPNYANARWYIALIHEERKDLDGAIGELEKILETNKDNQVVIGKLNELKKGRVSIPPARVIDQQPL